MAVVISHKGDFSKTLRFLKRIHSLSFYKKLDAYGREGVDALREATPKDTGVTSESWSYEIHRSGESVTLVWTNSNENHGVNIAVLIQYGHATRNGGFIQGIDYINPDIRPIFEKIASELWKEVVSDG